MSRYTINFGVAPPPPVPGGVAPKFGSEKVSRYTGVSQLQLRVSHYTVQLSACHGRTCHGVSTPPGCNPARLVDTPLVSDECDVSALGASPTLGRRGASTTKNNGGGQRYPLTQFWPRKSINFLENRQFKM